MKIGLDFDGVISNCGKLKSDGARKLYGVEISPDDFKKELVVGKGILTSEQYRNLQRQIYDNREIGLSMVPVDGVLEFVPRLQMEGYDLTVVTSRRELEIPNEWSKLHGLHLNMVGVGEGSKAGACSGLDVYIDDDLDKLELLVGIVPNRYLFSWGYNRHIDIPENVAKRIESWKQFYEEIVSLNRH